MGDDDVSQLGHRRGAGRLHVERSHVDDRLLDRHEGEVAEPHARPLPVQQGDRRRDVLVGEDVRVDDGRAVDRRRQLVHHEPSVLVGIALRDHERRELGTGVAPGDRHERPQHDERLALLLGEAHQQVVRVDASRPGAGLLTRGVGDRGDLTAAVDGDARVLGHRPRPVLRVELPRVVDPVATPHVGLDREEVLGVAQIVDEVLGHLLERREQVGERLGVGPHERVVGVDDVERDRAVVRVDHRLHRVAHVVEVATQTRPVADLLGVRPLRVREPVRRRVAVDDVEDAAVGDDRVRVGVEAEERRHGTDPVAHVADVEDL